jgi:hypothetical protein
LKGFELKRFEFEKSFKRKKSKGKKTYLPFQLSRPTTHLPSPAMARLSTFLFP